MQEMFSHILDDDEQIIKVFKPNKAKLYLSTFFVVNISVVWFALVAILAILLPEEGVAQPIYILIPVGVWILANIVTLALLGLHYSNVYYAYTNKKIIIRSGIFGVDYRSLDLATIGAVDVYVSLFDKILRQNTGSITYGSASSPVTEGKYGTSYKFSHIEMPYETCKEIKSYIAKQKK